MITIIYHGDQDGFMSAYLLMQCLGDNTFRFVEIQYGDQLDELCGPEVVNEQNVFMVDFTFPSDYMEKLANRANKLVVVDHHLSAVDKVRSVQDRDDTLVILDTSGHKAACGLVLEHINKIIDFAGYPTEHIGNMEKYELLTEYIEDADLFKREALNWQEVTAYIRSFPLEFMAYNQLVRKMNTDFEGAVEIGEALVRSMNLQREKVVKSNTRYLTTTEGEVAITNVPAYLPGAVGNHVAYSKPVVYAIDWWMGVDNKMNLSFRSKNADVRKVAESLGGGGHPRASGAKIDLQSDYAKWIMGV